MSDDSVGMIALTLICAVIIFLAYKAGTGYFIAAISIIGTVLILNFIHIITKKEKGTESEESDSEN